MDDRPNLPPDLPDPTGPSPEPGAALGPTRAADATIGGADDTTASTDPSALGPPGPHRSLSRRRFLTVGGGAALVAAGGIAAWSRLVQDRVEVVAPGAPVASGTSVPGIAPVGGGRVLVVVQMTGGNDGLATLVPADGRLHDVRPTLAPAGDRLVALPGTDRFAMAAELAPLLSAWQEGSLAFVDGVGFPQPNRSHFAAQDMWWSAQPGQPLTTGWLGRWLDATGDAEDPLRAIALGAASPALVGERALPTVVLDPAGFAVSTHRGIDAAALTDAFRATAAPLAADPALVAAQHSVPAALDAVSVLERATAAAVTDDEDDPVGGPATSSTTRPAKAGAAGPRTGSARQLLSVAAGLIDLQLGTQVILVSVDGYDTHSDQLARHAALLDDLGAGLAELTAAVQRKGRADDVLVMTTSEFGRRVAENGSGTDHGKAGVQLLLGPAVAGGQVVGDVDLARLDDGDLRAEVDVRSVYAAALDWLGGPTDEVLGATFDRLGLVRP